jgi:pimeloyl-ACP methyl ester carboxylesterase
MAETRRTTSIPRSLLALEWPRALFEAATLPAAWPFLRTAPRGDGQPVLVLPGYWAGDGSTTALRAYLRAHGYRTHRWGLGQNLGLEDGVCGRLLARLDALHARYGRAVSVVGQSLGGVYARELAKLAPARVRQVITLGSPFGMERRRSNGGWLASMVFGPSLGPDAGRIADPPPVPVTAIVSRSDGIAGFRDCLEAPGPRAENVEVVGSHIGLGLNPLALFAIADRLAQPEGAWRNFDRSGLRGVLYR